MGLLKVRFPPETDQIAGIAERPSRAIKGQCAMSGFKSVFPRSGTSVGPAGTSATALVWPNTRAYALSMAQQSGSGTMLRYMQIMMRNDTGTFIVSVLLVLILAFGLWDILHVVKR